MSAPNTNIETEKKRHMGPLVGFAAVVVFAGLLLFAYLNVAVDADVQDPLNDAAAAPVSETTQ